MTMVNRTCECCEREGVKLAGVASSSLGPISLAFCIECIAYRAEPLYLVQSLIEMAPSAKALYDEVVVFHNGEYKMFKEVPLK